MAAVVDASCGSRIVTCYRMCAKESLLVSTGMLCCLPSEDILVT